MNFGVVVVLFLTLLNDFYEKLEVWYGWPSQALLHAIILEQSICVSCFEEGASEPNTLSSLKTTTKVVKIDSHPPPPLLCCLDVSFVLTLVLSISFLLVTELELTRGFCTMGQVVWNQRAEVSVLYSRHQLPFSQWTGAGNMSLPTLCSLFT